MSIDILASQKRFPPMIRRKQWWPFSNGNSSGISFGLPAMVAYKVLESSTRAVLEEAS